MIDGVHIDIADKAGLVPSFTQGKSLGFNGKSLIYPSQISAANAHFSPTDDGHMHASKIINVRAFALLTENWWKTFTLMKRKKLLISLTRSIPESVDNEQSRVGTSHRKRKIKAKCTKVE